MTTIFKIYVPDLLRFIPYSSHFHIIQKSWPKILSSTSTDIMTHLVSSRISVHSQNEVDVICQERTSSVTFIGEKHNPNWHIYLSVTHLSRWNSHANVFRVSRKGRNDSRQWQHIISPTIKYSSPVAMDTPTPSSGSNVLNGLHETSRSILRDIEHSDPQFIMLLVLRDQIAFRQVTLTCLSSQRALPTHALSRLALLSITTRTDNTFCVFEEVTALNDNTRNTKPSQHCHYFALSEMDAILRAQSPTNGELIAHPSCSPSCRFLDDVSCLADDASDAIPVANEQDDITTHVIPWRRSIK